MDTIKNYLDNMFMQLSETEEVRKAKSAMAEMMEDKYNQLKAEGKSENEAIGIVISEFGNINEVMEELGISTGNKGNVDGEINGTSVTGVKSTATEPKKPLKKVSARECESYIQDNIAVSKYIATGVVLCICSPILLIVLAAFQEYKDFASEAVVTVIGLCALFVMVATAVAMFILFGSRVAKYDWLEKQAFELEPGAGYSVASRREAVRPYATIRTTVGVVLCIVSVIPLLCTSLLENTANGEFYTVICVGILLAMVATAVYLFITGNTELDCCKVLLQEEEYDIEIKTNPAYGIVGGIYWPLVVAGYLAWSFITDDWDTTWIVWPVAGVLFGAISGIIKVTTRKHND